MEGNNMAEIGTAYVDVVPRFDPDIPRIQILELPKEHGGPYSRTPFMVIIDGVSADSPIHDIVRDDLKQAFGAQGVIITEARIAI